MNNFITFCGVFRNEAPRVRYILDLIKGLDIPMVLAIQGSEDRTLEICKEYTSQYLYHPSQSPEESKDEIMDQIETPWTLWFDADEFPSFSLIRFIETFNPIFFMGYDGLKFPRINYVDGKIVTGGQDDKQFKMVSKNVRWKPAERGQRIHIHPIINFPKELPMEIYHHRTLEKIEKQTQRWNELEPKTKMACDKYVADVKKELND